MSLDKLTGNEIAIIGMDCRFPGANNVDEYWNNLINGVESIKKIDATDSQHPSPESTNKVGQLKRVNAVSTMEDVELFDANFFDYSPKEAALMDPQHRVFLECAWSALESAGYRPSDCGGKVGVFAGSRMNTYLLNLLSNRDAVGEMTQFELASGNDSSCVATRVSYKLNLNGPSYSINTACSTGLTVLHLACQSLLIGESDMAVSGGVSIMVPNNEGYLYREGGISSPDGHCRAFDKNASGTVLGSGIGVVVLKRYVDAIRDKNTVLAIVKGTAANNDGSSKANFTAPSVDGQISVISDALSLSEVDAESIGYVEAHGTGTPIGDPIEIRALTQAFEQYTKKKTYCAIGSVKSNIGHLENAAGMAGLIKTVLAIKNKKIPPSINFDEPNRAIDFDNSPFYVSDKLSDWVTDSVPRRAGISSFGIGGTNIHAILEEASIEQRVKEEHKSQLLVFSAKSKVSLGNAIDNMRLYLESVDHVDLADVAHTLRVGREEFQYRAYFVCVNIDDAIGKLKNYDSLSLVPLGRDEQPNIVFAFPGQGSQYASMAKELYQEHKYFRQQVDHCLSLVDDRFAQELRTVLLDGDDSQTNSVNQTRLAQASLFVTEYSLAKLLISSGIKPTAMLGHSVGEYVAACLSGVFSLDDALTLIVKRGELMQTVKPGSMLNVQLTKGEVEELLPHSLSIAVINAVNSIVVSGTTKEIDDFAQTLSDSSIGCTKLHTSHAFHSDMMQSIYKDFISTFESIEMHVPDIAFYSNYTGNIINNEEACSPEYWANHLVSTVRFADNVKNLMDAHPVQNNYIIEVGPGNSLTQLVNANISNHENENVRVSPSMAGSNNKLSQNLLLNRLVGTLWKSGQKLHWDNFIPDGSRMRIPIPTYAFDRRRYWIEPKTIQFDAAGPNPSEITESVDPMSIVSQQHDEDAAIRHPRPDLDNEYVKPATPDEEKMAEAWQDVLGIENIGVNDDFFDLGGHSLLVTMLVGRLKSVFDTTMSMEMFFETPTIRGVIDAIEVHKAAAAEPSIKTDILSLLDSISEEEAQERLAELD